VSEKADNEAALVSMLNGDGIMSEIAMELLTSWEQGALSMGEPADYTPTPADIHDQQERLVIHRRRLAQLQRQLAQYGAAAVPAHIPLEIDDLRVAISTIKHTLDTWQISAPDHPDDTTMVLSPTAASEFLTESTATIGELPGDPAIRALRVTPYTELWKLLKPLARYDLPQPITIPLLTELSIALRDWYFDTGGLFLSEAARTPYFALKETIRLISKRVRQDGIEQLRNEEIAIVLAAASTLRTHLAKDLGTR
jgi:hypothetical protein